MSFENLKSSMHAKWVHRVILVPYSLAVGAFDSWLVKKLICHAPLEYSIRWVPWFLALLGVIVIAFLLGILLDRGLVKGNSRGVTVLHTGYIAFLSLCMADVPAVEKPNKTMILCLTLFSVAELITDAVYCYDVFHERLGPKWDRWWVRTMIYPAFGLIFMVVYLCYGRSSEKVSNLTYSLFAASLSVLYVQYVYNHRLVPEAGPFKEIHGISSNDRPRGAEGTC